MIILSGCATTNYEEFVCISLPEMPLAGDKVADEIALVCNNDRCPHTIQWLNDLHAFRQEYLIYKSNLSK